MATDVKGMDAFSTEMSRRGLEHRWIDVNRQQSIVDRRDQLFAGEGKTSGVDTGISSVHSTVRRRCGPYHCGSGTSKERLTSDHCTYTILDLTTTKPIPDSMDWTERFTGPSELQIRRYADTRTH